MTDKEIEDLVYNYPTKNKHGFSSKEMEDLLSEIGGLDARKYNDAMRGITCMVDKGGRYYRVSRGCGEWHPSRAWYGIFLGLK